MKPIAIFLFCVLMVGKISLVLLIFRNGKKVPCIPIVQDTRFHVISNHLEFSSTKR